MDFAGVKQIDEVEIFSVQDAYAAPGEPTVGQTFSLYGLRDFEVQYWTGTAWQPVPGGTVVGNTLVWRSVSFSPVTTARIRIWVTRAVDQWSRITEVEAWGTAVTTTPPVVSVTAPVEGATYTSPASVALTATASDPDGTVSRVDFYADGTLVQSVATTPVQTGPNQTSTYSATWANAGTGSHSVTAVAIDDLGASGTSTPVHVTVLAPAGRLNVALAANGGSALASSTMNAGHSASGAINGDRKGSNWANGGGWNDFTSNAWPDWLEKWTSPA